MIVFYGWGYRGRTLDELRTARKKLNALIVDVRLVPQSRLAQFRRRALAREFGDDYCWLRAFGNINYKNPAGGVHLVEAVAGVAAFEQLGISPTRPALLLCGCPTLDCHRVAVARLLVEKFGGQFVDLSGATTEEQHERSTLPTA